MRERRIYLETTKISAKRTAGQISELLGDCGARAVMIEYDEAGKVAAIAFQVVVGGQTVPYRLPIRVEPLLALLRKKRRDVKLEQAENIAWRQVYRWLQAQLAMIDTGMVELPEVMLPYLHVGLNETLYQRLAGRGFQALTGEISAPIKEKK